ncbi:crotonyl-CoA carboxylase/reductase [Pseudonocardia asaccharolytica]|uniref:Crotonyl-CoA carboxylase/reductase n=1 Tax=Pseudonocardia asaccharolytica DSM 44247 = NBRC 16224 TaxID=1123024 RepID=A0A511CXG9_9PSEU|nr:crotonyl-CoA carboxylase/reductase [Pseudonocardia asaccharolytica]GEL17242.1 crotonyl-CoA carboxylase/reductase [Pseudonocardia asaccharolytica DSM 44247 = NBRC 16224]
MSISDEARVDVTTPGLESVPVGELPPVGTVPRNMYAQVVRQSRFGDPATAFQVEKIATPRIGPGEVLVAVMAAGVNYNNVWAARGYPVDVIAQRMRAGGAEDFHIGGSDASGIVYAVGDGVDDVEIGQHVVVHPGYWEPDDPWIAKGKDPMLAPSARIWGYDAEINFGSFAQFCRVQRHQLLPKAEHLTWEEAAAPTLVGTTAYRMLHGWAGNEVRDGDVVLVWGGSGGLGTQAAQLAAAAGARVVAVVSDERRGEYAVKYGAIGWINRHDFGHWGLPPKISDKAGQEAWSASARAFGKRIWEIVGERRDPAIVFEHPGESTVPTSIFVCEPGGMVVICAGTTGYEAMVDLRYHWTRQKRLQGSHGTNDEQARAYNDLVLAGRIDPCLGRAIRFEELPAAHAAMGRGEDVFGNIVALIGAGVLGGGRVS